MCIEWLNFSHIVTFIVSILSQYLWSQDTPTIPEDKDLLYSSLEIQSPDYAPHSKTSLPSQDEIKESVSKDFEFQKSESSKMEARSKDYSALKLEDTRMDESRGKRSVMVRFMSPRKYSSAQKKALRRDYSIDQKTDRLFKEFTYKDSSNIDAEYSCHTLPRRSRKVEKVSEPPQEGLSTRIAPKSECPLLSSQESVVVEDRNPLRNLANFRSVSGSSRSLISPDLIKWDMLKHDHF